MSFVPGKWENITWGGQVAGKETMAQYAEVEI